MQERLGIFSLKYAESALLPCRGQLTWKVRSEQSESRLSDAGFQERRLRIEPATSSPEERTHFHVSLRQVKNQTIRILDVTSRDLRLIFNYLAAFFCETCSRFLNAFDGNF